MNHIPCHIAHGERGVEAVANAREDVGVSAQRSKQPVKVGPGELPFAVVKNRWDRLGHDVGKNLRSDYAASQFDCGYRGGIRAGPPVEFTPSAATTMAPRYDAPFSKTAVTSPSRPVTVLSRCP